MKTELKNKTEKLNFAVSAAMGWLNDRADRWPKSVVLNTGEVRDLLKEFVASDRLAFDRKLKSKEKWRAQFLLAVYFIDKFEKH